MRYLTLAASIIPIICAAVPAVSAPAHNTARTATQCEALAVQRQNGPGMIYHRRFIRECVAGKVSELTSMTYDECERLAEERGSGAAGPGHIGHQRFMTQCMAGRIPRTVPPRRT